MKNMNKNKKLGFIALFVAFAMLIGTSLAYFTDYATTQATGTAGTVALSLDSGINLLDANGMDIINPGDRRDAGFTVTNEGNKSVDVRTTIALTAVDYAGNAIEFTGAADAQSEYDLYMRNDVSLVEGQGYKPNTDAIPLQVKSVEGNKITYILPEYILNGNSDKYDEVETVDGIDAFSKFNDIVFVMKGEAGNEWQDSSVQIDIIVEAKQHENTQAGWDIVAKEEVTHGEITKDVVMGEIVITPLDKNEESTDDDEDKNEEVTNDIELVFYNIVPGEDGDSILYEDNKPFHFFAEGTPIAAKESALYSFTTDENAKVFLNSADIENGTYDVYVECLFYDENGQTTPTGELIPFSSVTIDGPGTYNITYILEDS
jgi:predicted ribosomally synthesized peptide with SipW-like signal peptide